MNEHLKGNLEALLKRYSGFQRDVESRINQLSVQPSQDHLKQPVVKTLNHKRGSGVFFVEGVGAGECFEWIRPFASKEQIIVIVVERDWGRFLNSLAYTDLRWLIENPRVHFVITNKFAEFASQILTPFHIKRGASLLPYLSIIRAADLTEEDLKYFDLCERQLAANIDLFSSMTGYREDGLMGLRYLVENIPWIERTPGVALLENKFKGASAVVASTGPSLSKSLPLLKQIQHSHIIIAADASLKILLRAGIQPHFVCSLERELASKPFFEDIDPEQATAQLVAFPEVPSEVIQAYPGPKLVAFRRQRFHYYLQQQTRRGVIGAGHSVAHMCMQLAEYLGCARIALVGQDLAFDPDSLSTHAENVAYSTWSQANSEKELKEKLEKEKDKLFWMPGNLRESVPTRGYYIVFAWEFGAQTDYLKAKVNNCTAGGMQIPKILWQDFESWIRETPAACGIEAAIQEALSKPIEGRIDLRPIIQAIKSWESDLSNKSQVLRILGQQSLLGNEPLDWDFAHQSLVSLKALRSDHVVEAFAQDVLGREGIPLETQLVGLEAAQDLDGEALSSLAGYFDLVASALSESRSVLTQKAK